MAAEYLANMAQVVNPNAPIIFTASIPCTRGYVYHEDETGIFILRGITNGQCYATYQVTFNGNIASNGATVAPIAIALTVNGEERPTSRAVYTPAGVGELGNVTATAIIRVPKGCCFTLAVENIPVGEAGAEPTPVPITVENANLVINRIA